MIEILMQQENIHYENMQRYDFHLLRDFLNANNNHLIDACNSVYEDILWRSR